MLRRISYDHSSSNVYRGFLAYLSSLRLDGETYSEPDAAAHRADNHAHSRQLTPIFDGPQ
jgi:hypothetical protein